MSDRDHSALTASTASTALGPLLDEVLHQVDTLLAVAEDEGSFPTARTPVSGWTALEHAEHMAQADEGSLHQLDAALERDGGPRTRLAGRVILAIGWIPRGAGKAPETSRPQTRGRDEVVAALRSVRGRIAALGENLDRVAAARGRASHPIFGGLTPSQWLRFLRIHHHHHLKIIADIRQAYESGAK